MTENLSTRATRRRYLSGLSTFSAALICGCMGEDAPGGKEAPTRTEEPEPISVEDIPGLSSEGIENLDDLLAAYQESISGADFEYRMNFEYEGGQESYRAVVDRNTTRALIETVREEREVDRFSTEIGTVHNTGDGSPEPRLDTIYDDTVREIKDHADGSINDVFGLLNFGTPEEEGTHITLPITGISDEDAGFESVTDGNLIITGREIIANLSAVLQSEEGQEVSLEIETQVGEIDLEVPNWAKETLEAIEERGSHNPDVVERVSDVEPGDSVRVDVVIEGTRSTLFEEADVLSVQEIYEHGNYSVGIYLSESIIDHMGDLIENPRQEIDRITVLDGEDVSTGSFSHDLQEAIVSGEWQSGDRPYRIQVPNQEMAEKVAATIIEHR